MMRKRLTMVALLALALLLLPGRAYADFSLDPWGNGNIWTGRVNDTNFGAFTRANDIYDAAVYAIGQDPITLGSEVRSKLSDPNHGGYFYQFAQSFVNLEGSYDLPEWLPIYMLVMVPNYPDWPRYWKVEVPYSLRINAETDFRRVLAGEDLSGGGSGGGSQTYPSGQYYKIPLESWYGAALPTAFVGHYAYVHVPFVQEYSSFIDEHFPSRIKTFYILRNTNGSLTFSFGGASSFDVRSASNYTIRDSVGVRGYARIVIDNDFYLFKGSEISIDQGTPKDVIFNGGGLTPLYMASSSFDYPVVTLPVPSGTWPEPETPVTPTAPEQPTPTAPTVTPDPTVTEPTPTWPDVTININPDPTVSVTPTGLDYTELLTRINDNLNTINSYSVSINSNLNSLRSDLVSEFESVEQGLKNIYQYLQHFDSLLERHCKHLRDALDDGIYNLELYLKRLFEWLPQQLNFDANFDYDDSSIQTLLRRILTKIPGTNSGLPNDTMPNPVADEPGFFDWLSDLWHRFLIDLVSVLPDELGGLVDAFSQLTHYFPFSIPWDLAALLALFEHEPVTPEFDVPWGFGGGDGEVEMVHVDLSPWDGVMQMVRPVFVVGFCWQLAMITKDLLSGFDINKGGV